MLFGNIRLMPQTNLLRALNKYILKSSVKKIRLHGFRHIHASLLINCGCDSREVTDRPWRHYSNC